MHYQSYWFKKKWISCLCLRFKEQCLREAFFFWNRKKNLTFTERTSKRKHENETFCCWTMTVSNFFYMCNRLRMLHLLSCTASACICTCFRRILDHNVAQEATYTDKAHTWQYQENVNLTFPTLCTVLPSPFGSQTVPILGHCCLLQQSSTPYFC